MKLLLNIYADNMTKCKFCTTDVLGIKVESRYRDCCYAASTSVCCYSMLKLSLNKTTCLNPQKHYRTTHRTPNPAIYWTHKTCRSSSPQLVRALNAWWIHWVSLREEIPRSFYSIIQTIKHDMSERHSTSSGTKHLSPYCQSDITLMLFTLYKFHREVVLLDSLMYTAALYMSQCRAVTSAVSLLVLHEPIFRFNQPYLRSYSRLSQNPKRTFRINTSFTGRMPFL